jgi:hypothetical protein
LISSFGLAFDHSYTDYNTALNELVVDQGSSSLVHYKKLQKSNKSMNLFLKRLQKLTPKEFSSFSEKQKLALWINAYNAFTLKIVADHYPIKSIKDIGSVFKNVWKMKFIIMMGKTISLDHIEHEVLRKEFNEPRIHFAINCASIGCPKLRAEAYNETDLETQLNEQTRLFLRDSSRNRLNAETKILSVSKIFSWFKEDFTKDNKTLAQFIAPFITDDVKIQDELRSGKYTIEHLEYDWSLNDAKEK